MIDNPLLAFLDTVNCEEVVNGNKIFLAIRIVVAVIGAALGWMISSPLWRGMYWLMVRKSMPGLLLVPMRLLAAAAVGAAVFLFLPVGFGGFGGLGSGGGQGDGQGPGKGSGTGTGTGSVTDSNAKGNSSSKNKDGSENGTEKIDVEVLGGDNYKKDGKYVHGEGKFYKVKLAGKDPSFLTFDEIKTLFSQRKDQVTVILHITDESVEGYDRDILIKLITDRKIKLINPNK